MRNRPVRTPTRAGRKSGGSPRRRARVPAPYQPRVQCGAWGRGPQQHVVVKAGGDRVPGSQGGCWRCRHLSLKGPRPGHWQAHWLSARARGRHSSPQSDRDVRGGNKWTNSGRGCRASRKGNALKDTGAGQCHSSFVELPPVPTPPARHRWAPSPSRLRPAPPNSWCSQNPSSNFSTPATSLSPRC